MQQKMGGLVRQVTGLSPRLRPADVSSVTHGQHSCVVARNGRARLGRVVVTAAHVATGPKYCRLRGVVAIAAPDAISRELFDQRARPGNNTASNQLTTMRKDRFFEIEMEVRDDEVDEYGVVNNAIYASYLHSGRDGMLEQLGISVDYWTSTGNAMALSELNLKYFAPLTLVLEGRATAVCLNKDFRPTRVFPELSASLMEVFSCKVA